MSHVKKSFGELDVLKDISLNVEEGEVVAIILSLIHISEPTRH